MSTYIPSDVAVKILSTLPAKSLIRFRCVSKTWNALIGNPDFLSRNLLNNSILSTSATQNPKSLILVKTRDKSNVRNQNYSFLSYDTLDGASQIPPYHQRLTIHPQVSIVGSCNGLLCLFDIIGFVVSVWNLASVIPRLESTLPNCHFGVLPYSVGFGFGFDRRNNEFKVVMLFHGFQGHLVEVYGLKSGRWRRPAADLRVPLLFPDNLQTAALDGVFLWYDDSKSDDHAGGTLVSFDFSDEKFQTTPLPDYGESESTRTRTLMVLKGSVAVVVFAPAKMCLDIWVLLEFGVEESWTRFVTTGLPLDLERPLGFWKNGELFMEDCEGQLIVYDPFTRTRKNLQIEGVKGSLQLILYTQK